MLLIEDDTLVHVDSASDVLEHYGVKGMKWGKRRAAIAAGIKSGAKRAGKWGVAALGTTALGTTARAYTQPGRYSRRVNELQRARETRDNKLALIRSTEDLNRMNRYTDSRVALKKRLKSENKGQSIKTKFKNYGKHLDRVSALDKKYVNGR